MTKIAKLLVWTLVLTVAPLAAFAEEAAASGDGTWGYALGAGLAVGLAGLGCASARASPPATTWPALRATRVRLAACS
jgi:hypothetical protein